MFHLRNRKKVSHRTKERVNEWKHVTKEKDKDKESVEEKEKIKKREKELPRLIKRFPPSVFNLQ